MTETKKTGLLAHPKVRQLFGIDLRALATLRIGLGLLILADLVWRAPHIEGFYSDVGALPRSAAGTFTLYGLSGSVAFQAVLFVVAAVFAVMLTIGYQTWIATAASWFLLASMHQRNLLLNNSGDHLLVLLLFWGMFLPYGARASVDARTGRIGRELPRVVLSVGSLALLMQVFFVYFFTALLKNYQVWVEDQSALYLALNLDKFARPAGRALLDFPMIVAWLSPLTWWAELLGPFLPFVPWRTPLFRTLAAAAFIGFHLTLIAVFELAMFAYICIVAWIVFLPPEFWDRLARLRLAGRVAASWEWVVDRISGGISALARRRPWVLAPPIDHEASRAGSVIAGALLLLALVVNIGTLAPDSKFSREVASIASNLYVKQRWKMFAPRPPLEDGWWVAPATLRDGTEVDLLSGASPVVWEKPESVIRSFRTPRWRKYLGYVWGAEHRDKVRHYADWVRYRWDRRHDPSTRVQSMKLYHMLEVTRPDYQPPFRADVMVYEWNGEGTGRVVSFRESVIQASEGS